jgi:hypothetical protein
VAPNEGEIGALHSKEQNMEAVMIPAKTVVHINGIPVALAVDTIVETAYDNMKHLTGYHYAHISDAPDSTDTPGRTREPEQET